MGLGPDERTFIEIVECVGTIDETVQERLNLKVRRMAQALDDPGLKIDPLPLDPPTIEDPDEYTVGLLTEDVEDLLRHFRRGGQR